MKRSSSISRTFFRRPAVRDLVPDLKLVLAVLTIGCESHAGIYMPGGLAEDAGLDPAALVGALADLERRGHIVRDGETGEIFLASFYRDNTFATPQRHRQWTDDISRVESASLRAAALAAVAASPECGLAVDKNTENGQNQQLNNQGKGKGKGKEREREAAAGAAAVSKTEPLAKPLAEGTVLQKKLNALLTSARRHGGDEQRDEAAIAFITEIAAQVGDERVMKAIAAAPLPDAAKKAVIAAGLDQAAAAAAAGKASADAEARRLAALAASTAQVQAQANTANANSFHLRR